MDIQKILELHKRWLNGEPDGALTSCGALTCGALMWITLASRFGGVRCI